MVYLEFVLFIQRAQCQFLPQTLKKLSCQFAWRKEKPRNEYTSFKLEQGLIANLGLLLSNPNPVTKWNGVMRTIGRPIVRNGFSKHFIPIACTKKDPLVFNRFYLLEQKLNSKIASAGQLFSSYHIFISVVYLSLQAATTSQFFISYTIRTFGALIFATLMTTRQVSCSNLQDLILKSENEVLEHIPSRCS